MSLRFTRFRFIVLFCALASASLAPAQTVTTVDNPANSVASQAKHYVVLVSLDGFRYDYPTKFGTPHLLALGAAGASAPDGMLPSFPSLTFPNHITLVTGLYPEHHGIVANSFRDPSRPGGTDGAENVYVYTQPSSNGDGTWYTGTPLWALAEQQGMRSACLFWPGSEAEIQGKRPSYYLKYDNTLDNHKRIDQVIAWLQLPPELRPHFITLYYYDVDHFAHKTTPDSPETRDAVHKMDDLIGELHTRLDALHLPIDLVVLADHGMATVEPPSIALSDYSELKDINAVGTLLYPASEAAAQAAYEEFRKHPTDKFTAYRRADLPAHLHMDKNARIGDPVIIANGPYRIYPRPHGPGDPGEHGFDPTRFPQMKAIFFAAGPDIKPGIKLPTFENIHVYPFIAKLLDLHTPIVDGKLQVLAPILADVSIKVNMVKEPASERSTLVPVSKDEPVKFGLGVTPPGILHSAPLNYSKQASEAHLNGTVLLLVRVEADGHPSRVTVLKGLGMGLDGSAVKSVSESTFTPALKDGKPVVVEMKMEMSYQQQ